MILYSQGYRFDFQTKKLTQTGAFYFKVSPKKAKVYLNGEFKEETSSFSGTAFLENLTPGRYFIEIKKPGYYPWRKNLEIKEKQVTCAENIVLIPKNIEFKEVNSLKVNFSQNISTTTFPTPPEFFNFKKFSLSPDKEKVAFYNLYEVWIYFLNKKCEEKLERECERKFFLTRFSKKIKKVAWLDDYHLIISVGDKIKITEIDTRDKLNIIDLLKNLKNSDFVWDINSKKLYIKNNKKIFVTSQLLSF